MYVALIEKMSRGYPGLCGGFMFIRDTFITAPSFSLHCGSRRLPEHQPFQATGKRKGKRRGVCPVPLKETFLRAHTVLPSATYSQPWKQGNDIWV